MKPVCNFCTFGMFCTNTETDIFVKLADGETGNWSGSFNF